MRPRLVALRIGNRYTNKRKEATIRLFAFYNTAKKCTFKILNRSRGFAARGCDGRSLQLVRDLPALVPLGTDNATCVAALRCAHANCKSAVC